MTNRESAPRPASTLLRFGLYTAAAYAVLLGGTFTGILVPRLQFISLILLAALGCGWLVVVWRGRLTVPGGALWPALVLWGAAFGVALAAHPAGRSAIALWTMALYALLWIALSDLRQRGLPARLLTDSLLFVTVPLVIFAWVQVLPWYPAWLSAHELGVPFFPARPVSTLGNPNVLGALLAMALPLAVVRARALPRRFDRVALGALALAIVLTLALTFSRGAWLGAAAGLAALVGLVAVEPWARGGPVWARLIPRRRSTRLAALAALILILIVGGVAAWAMARALDTPQRETGARLSYYRLALETFADHPLTGTGLFTFGRELAAAGSIPPEQPHAHAHNLPLNVAAELGLPGLIALGATALLIGRIGWRAISRAESHRAREHEAACLAALTALSVHSLVDMPLMVPAIVVAALMIAAASGGARERDLRQAISRRCRRAVPAVYTIAVAAMVGVGGWSLGVTQTYTHGVALVDAGYYREGMSELQVAADAQPWLPLYAAELGYAAGLAAARGDAAAVGQGIAAYERALDAEPQHTLWWANLSALYRQRGDDAAALDAIAHAARLAPDDPDVWVNLGRSYETAGAWQRAAAAYRRALHLAPRYRAAAFWHETPLRRMAAAIAAPRIFPEAVARVMWQNGQRDAAIALLKRAITDDSNQPRPYAEIAALYVASGELSTAQAYLDAARLLAGTAPDTSRINLIEAQIAAARGDPVTAAARLRDARAALGSGRTGYPLLYGMDEANYQYLRLTVEGALLPQLVVLWPEPALTEALRRGV